MRVASGLLDVRHVAGDPSLTIRLRTATLAEWRRGAKQRLPELHEIVLSRHRLIGELAHMSVPDLKEAEGGLRDATVLKSLMATWLVDIPAADLERSRQQLLDVRDLLHAAAGRATDRIAPEHWSALAEALGLPDDRAAQRQVRELGRRLTHLSRLVWRRADDAVRRTPAGKPRRPELERLAPGVALSQGEVVLDRGAQPRLRPGAAAPRGGRGRAAQRRPGSADRGPAGAGVPAAARPLARGGAARAGPPARRRSWPARGLGDARGDRRAVRDPARVGADPAAAARLGHPSVHRRPPRRRDLHRGVGPDPRGVARPDVLLVAALLHDIGKGGVVEHSAAGEPIARAIATRMGFDQDAVDLIAQLVRWHLLLATTATTRDPGRPGDHRAAHRAPPDTRGARPADRAHRGRRQGDLGQGLDVVARRAHPRPVATHACRARARERPGIDRRRRDRDPGGRAVDGSIAITVDPVDDGSRVTTVSVDRVGLLADCAATFALQRLQVRAARIWAQGEYGVAVWDVADDHLDAGRLRNMFDSVAARRVDPAERLAPRTNGRGPTSPRRSSYGPRPATRRP